MGIRKSEKSIVHFAAMLTVDYMVSGVRHSRTCLRRSQRPPARNPRRIDPLKRRLGAKFRRILQWSSGSSFLGHRLKPARHSRCRWARQRRSRRRQNSSDADRCFEEN